VYINVIDISFNDNITDTNTDTYTDIEVNRFDNIYTRYRLVKIPQYTNINVNQGSDIDRGIFSVFVDLFKSTNTSIKYFSSYFVSNIRYENDTYSILELIYSQHFTILINQELIYINNLESIYNIMYNNIIENMSTVN
jgi:hypothetical protein